MRMEALIVYACDWPGCTQRVEVAGEDVAGPTELAHEESGWLLKWKADTRVSTMREDFCPKHGRCSWCKERKPRNRLTAGIGECEGQMICATCIIEREA